MLHASQRLKTDAQRRYWLCWPGEHYRFLAALVATIDARNVVEIGTFTGMGTLAMLSGGAARVTTFDIAPWKSFLDTVLTETDFDRQVVQVVADLAEDNTFSHWQSTVREADLILVDGPKDRVFEPALVGHLTRNRAEQGRPLVVFDDIRTLPLVNLWARMPARTLDVTSLAHWSGTGLAVFD
jgi:predicted O-methyltransferase YrrM